MVLLALVAGMALFDDLREKDGGTLYERRAGGFHYLKVGGASLRDDRTTFGHEN